MVALFIYTENIAINRLRTVVAEKSGLLHGNLAIRISLQIDKKEVRLKIQTVESEEKK